MKLIIVESEDSVMSHGVYLTVSETDKISRPLLSNQTSTKILEQLANVIKPITEATRRLLEFVKYMHIWR